MKQHRKTTLALVAVLVIAGLTLGAMAVLAQERTNASKVAEQTQVTAAAAPSESGVSTTGTEPGAGRRAVVAKGILTPVQHAALSMATGGIVSETLVKEGEPVTQGQVILRLRNERQQAAVAEAQGALAAGPGSTGHN